MFTYRIKSERRQCATEVCSTLTLGYKHNNSLAALNLQITNTYTSDKSNISLCKFPATPCEYGNNT